MNNKDRVVSGAITRENVRRFWPISLVSLLAYLSIGPVPMMTASLTSGPGGARAVGAGAVDMMDTPFNFSAFSAVGIVFAVISAVAVFRYLHSQEALSVVHALPVTRRTLFFSNFLSGLLLLLTPFVVVALIMLAMKGGGTDARFWLVWFAAVCVTLILTYALSVFAGMVSGTTSVHLLTAVLFNFAWALIFWFAIAQAQASLFGWSNESGLAGAVNYFHPHLYFMSDIDVNTITGLGVVSLRVGALVYLLIAAAVSAAASLVYLRFKPERAGRSITSRPAEYVFVFIIAAAGMFIGAALIGQFDPMYSYDGQIADPATYVNWPYLIGAIIGAVVAFIVSTMILRKRARVFDPAALRRFGLFAVAAAVLMVCTMTNVTGFETRVPDARDIKTAAFRVNAFLLPPYRYGIFGSSDIIGKEQNHMMFQFVDIPVSGDDGGLLADFQRRALEDRAYLYDPGTDEVDVVYLSGGSNQSVDIGYGLKRVGEEMRSYVFSGKYLLGSEEFARLLASDSVKDYLSIENLLGYDALNMPSIMYGESYDLLDAAPDTEVREKLTPDAMRELAERLDADYRAMDADDMLDPGDELFTLRLSSPGGKGGIYISMPTALAGKGEKENLQELTSRDHVDFALSYTVTEKGVSAVAYLKELGVYDSIVKTAEELKRSYESKNGLDYTESFSGAEELLWSIPHAANIARYREE
jgi:hypothetical protein